MISPLFVACTGSTTPEPTTGRPTEDSAEPTDSGTEAACDPGVGVITYRVCAETTAPQDDPYPVYDHDAVVTGEVTEVGALTPFPGSAPYYDFAACGNASRQVRLVDGSGVTWTVGWEIDGPIDDASTDALAIGATLTLEVDNSFVAYSYSRAFRLADADGPLMFYEGFLYASPPFDDAQRGLGAVVDLADACRAASPDGRISYRPVTFTGSTGSIQLRSGETAPLDLADRSLSLTVLGSTELVSCTDSCSGTAWTGWETP